MNLKELIERLTSTAEWCFLDSTDPNIDRLKFRGMTETLLNEYFREHYSL